MPGMDRNRPDAAARRGDELAALQGEVPAAARQVGDHDREL
jgi:hypothetical protein